MFDVVKYLLRYKDSSSNKSNLDLESSDFKDPDLIDELDSIVNHEGELNNVHYEITTGKINNGKLRVRFL